MAWYGGGFEFPEYVSVGTRRARARAAAEKIARKQKRSLAPIGPINGNKIARTFWGKAWCDNLEAYRDYENRLPRGRSYARNGAVIDLRIGAGSVAAIVSGTSIYEVAVKIEALPAKSWRPLASESTKQIDSLVDLLRGKLPTQVIELVTRKQGGLFPSPKEISFKCFVLTGPGCASTSPRRSTASVFVLRRSPSSSLSFAAWTTTSSSAERPKRSRASRTPQIVAR